MTLNRQDAEPQRTSYARFTPHLGSLPALPAIDWSAVGASAPNPVPFSGGALPAADVLVITWTGAEWAALEHVFLRSGRAMSASSARQSSWPEWRKYDAGLPAYTGHDAQDWRCWGWYTLVEIGGKRVLLFKSNTHLDWPGETYLAAMVERLVAEAKPGLLLSVGTAGGARLEDHLGAVNVSNAAVLYSAALPESKWPRYSSAFAPGWSLVERPGFDRLLAPVPATDVLLQELADQFNAFHHTSYPLGTLDNLGLNRPTRFPALNDLTVAATALLTTSTFVVGTSDGRFRNFACIEMDDAVIARVCGRSGTPYAFVRNISDPVQNAALPVRVQGDWGSAVYEAFGLYTSYNGALVTWAIVAAAPEAAGGAAEAALPLPG